MKEKTPLDLREGSTAVLLSVKVVPGGSRDRIVGPLEGALKVKVAAPPEKGAANRAVCRLLARQLGIRERQVRITAGNTRSRKTIAIEGLTPDEAKVRIQKLEDKS